MWASIKRILGVVFGVVGAIFTILDLAALLGVIFLPFSITTSNTLRGYIVGFVILGGALGYYFTATAWAGKGRKKCLQRRNRYFAIFWIPFGIFMTILT